MSGTLFRSSNGHPFVHGVLPNYMGAYNDFSNGGPVGSITTAVYPSGHMLGGTAIVPSIEGRVPPYINNSNDMSAPNVGNAFHNMPFSYLNPNNHAPESYSTTTTNGVNMSALNNTAFLSSSGVEPRSQTSTTSTNTGDALNPLLLRNRFQLRSPFQACANVNDFSLQQDFNRESEFITDMSPPSPVRTPARVPASEEVRSNVVMPNFDWEDEAIAQTPITRLQGNAAPVPRSAVDSHTSSAVMSPVNTDGSNPIARAVISHGNGTTLPYSTTCYPTPMHNNVDSASGYTAGDFQTTPNSTTTDGDVVNNKGKKRSAPDAVGDNTVPTKSAKTDSNNQVRGKGL